MTSLSWIELSVSICVIFFLTLPLNGHGHVVLDASRKGKADKVSEGIEIQNYMVSTKIKYRYSRTKVFCEMRNGNKVQSKEAEFKLDLPEDAFITNFTLETHNRTYKSVILGRIDANQKYARRRGNGETAALVNEHSGAFKVSINLAPNASVAFFLEYDEEIPKVVTGHLHYYRYRLSLIPNVSRVKHFCVVIDILEYKPFSIASLNLCSMESRKCVEIDFRRDGLIFAPEPGKNRTRIIWEPSDQVKQNLTEIGALGTFQMNYQFIGNESFNDVVIQNGYFIHRFDPRLLESLPLHIIFVLDVSGSMIGSRGQNMKLAISKIMKDMKETDFFHIIKFSSNFEEWEPPVALNYRIKGFYPAEYYFKQMATFYVNETEFSGNTNINDALIEALKIGEMSSSLYSKYCKGSFNKKLSCHNDSAVPVPMIFFLTDGYATTGTTDGLTILQTVKQKNLNGIRIFSIGLGHEADNDLLEALSYQNGGIARKIFDSAQVQLQLSDFYKFVASPVLTELKFHYHIRNVSLMEIYDASIDASKPRWLSSSEEYLVTGRVNVNVTYNRNIPNHHLQNGHGVSIGNYFNFDIGGKQMKLPARICPCGVCPRKAQNATEGRFLLEQLNKGNTGRLCNEDNEDSFMEKFWAHKMATKLSQDFVRTGDPVVKQKLVALSKKYHFVTPFTSLLIIIPQTKDGRNRIYYNSPGRTIVMQKAFKPASSQMVVNPQTDGHKLGYYSALSRNGSNNDSREPNQEAQPSITEYFNALRIEHSDLVHKMKHDHHKQNVLDNIPWVHSHGMTLRLKHGKSSAQDFHIWNITEDRVTTEKHKPSKCNRHEESGQKTRGKCVHLIDCLESEISQDLEKFLKHRFCPIRLK